MSVRRRVYLLVLKFFDGNEEKTRAWFRAPNPLLGGMRPTDYIALKPERMLRWVEGQLAENER